MEKEGNGLMGIADTSTAEGRLELLRQNGNVQIIRLEDGLFLASGEGWSVGKIFQLGRTEVEASEAFLQRHYDLLMGKQPVDQCARIYSPHRDY